ncbi:hypothetical protein NUW54_g5851 [Trametes sanguinea]|uniref:Uncharacterized protein n=1 Tax=Trametes sanguinea TaxID=158606 RepID=A0ACC1PVG2_9APHY|nr:hypothetical protein NUW54_g5851 [Trametes sanguinea]
MSRPSLPQLRLPSFQVIAWARAKHLYSPVLSIAIHSEDVAQSMSMQITRADQFKAEDTFGRASSWLRSDRRKCEFVTPHTPNSCPSPISRSWRAFRWLLCREESALTGACAHLWVPQSPKGIRALIYPHCEYQCLERPTIVPHGKAAMAFSAAENSSTKSKLVSIFVQSVLYGIYVTLFFTTTDALLQRPTMHVATNFSRIILAFVVHADSPGGPAAFFNELSNFTQMFGSTLYVLQTLLGDGMVLYRCYLVWERKWIVIAIPCLLLLGSTVTGIGILYSFDKVVPQASIFVVQLNHWITAFFSMTFVTNFICTALVAFRVWAKNRSTLSLKHHKLRPVMVLIVESSACYSATLLALLILYNVNSWFQYVVLDAVSAIVGIVFSLIMRRIATGISTVEGETALIEPSGVASGIQLSRTSFRGGTKGVPGPESPAESA